MSSFCFALSQWKGKEKKIMTPPYHKLAGLGYVGSGIGLSATTFIGVLLKDKATYGPDYIGFFTSAFELSMLTLMPFSLFFVDKYGGLRQMLTVYVSVGAGLLFLSCLTDDRTMIGVWVVLFLFILAPCPRLWDRAVLQTLGKENAENWGQYRLMQSVLFGLGAPACAALRHLIGWIAMPIQFAVGYSLICIAPYYWHKHESDIVHVEVAAEQPPDIRLSDVFSFVFSDRRLWLFLLANTMLGFPFAIVQYFLPVHMKDLGASTLLVGFSTATTTATETIVFLFSATILKRISLERLYQLGLVCMIVQLAGYAVAREAWMVLPVDLLHGGSFAATWLACEQLFSTRMPKEFAATGFGILSMFSYGIGPLIGNICGGLIFSKWDARVMFWAFCAWTALILVFFTILAPPPRPSLLEAKQQLHVVSSVTPTDLTSSIQQTDRIGEKGSPNEKSLLVA